MEKQLINRWRTWLALFVLVCFAAPSMARVVDGGDIKPAALQMPSANINTDNGTIEVRIPFYNWKKADEGLLEDSYIMFGSQKVLNLRSFEKQGTEQNGNGETSYWIDIKKNSSFDTWFTKAYVDGDWTSEYQADHHDKTYSYWINSSSATGVLKRSWSDIKKVNDSKSEDCFVTIRFYLNEKALKSGGTFAVKLHCDINNSDEYFVEKTQTINKLSLPELSVSHDLARGVEGKYDVTASVSGSIDCKNYKLTANDGSSAHATSSDKNKTWRYDVLGYSQSKTFTMSYEFSGNCTVTSSKTVTIPSYDYVNGFNLADGENGSTNLSWSTVEASGGISAGDFLIKREVEGATKEFKVSASERSFKDPETINYPKGTSVKYTIRREFPREWTSFKAVTWTIVKQNEHAVVEDFVSASLLTQRRAKLEWKWNVGSSNSTVLTDNSKIVLVRKRSSDGKAFSVDATTEIPCTEFLEGGKYYQENSDGTCYYTDSFEQSCVLYQWEIKLKPGNTIYSEQMAALASQYRVPVRDEYGEIKYDEDGNIEYGTIDPNTKEPYIGLNDTEVAGLSSFEASHGYFGDRVELSWTLSEEGGSLDVFSIQRREKKENGESKFLQIATVEGISGIVSYSYTDTRAVPGKVYEYLIEGSKECADQEVKTKKFTHGFSTPTGNVYGRLTFTSENGQAVNNAEVRLETKANIIGKSYKFGGQYHLAVANDSLLSAQKADAVSFQLFAKFDGSHQSDKQILLQQGSNFAIYAQNDELHFQVADIDLAAAEKISALTNQKNFVQITAVSAADSVRLYVDNVCMGAALQTNTGASVSKGALTMGNGFYGFLDEVRVWGKALTADEVTQTYDRYLSGDEEGLLAYWNFNYSIETEFYDVAHKDAEYFMNDGRVADLEGKVVKGILTSSLADNPTTNQLAYKDYTDTDGSYYISGVPYIGNGTLYSVIPRLGTHAFSPTKTQVTLSAGSVNHSANFIDKSAFPVSGTVRYEGSTIPVEGVQFFVDGVVCSDSKGNIVQTDADGRFKIDVPVGIHEVKAKMANHEFKNEGRLLDDYGRDINYQDDRYSTVELWDVTTVKLVGRVAGGAIQEELPVGHSISTNNLGDGISIQLTYENPAYQLTTSESDVTKTMTHYQPSNWKAEGKVANDNKVIFRGKSNIVTIIPNKETGEFVAELLPIPYAVKVNAPAAYSNISGNNSKLNLTNVFVKQFEPYEYVDSTLVNNEMVKTSYNDTVYYNQKQLFIARVKPVVNVEQMSGSTPLAYFGSEETQYMAVDGTKTTKLYNEEDGKYLLGLPVFTQYEPYRLRASVYEEYKYYTEQGDVDPDRATDKVPAQDAVVNFQTTMSSSNGSVSIEADSTGVAYWDFAVNKIDLTSASANINIRATVGKDDNATSFAWTSPFDANNKVITLGSVNRGNDFVTAGPDKLLAVLRDPPGSNSYSYLEKGVTFTESSQYTGGITQTGTEDIITKTGVELVTFTGLGGGTINSATTSNGLTVNLEHSEEWTNSHTKTSTTTINTRFQTSSDPDYVGDMGDTFLGYSTNLSYGTAECVTLVTKEKYNAKKDSYQLLAFADAQGQYVLVRTKAMSVGTTFDTFFAYPLVHIESQLLPQLYELRGSFLHQAWEMTPEQFQAEANTTKAPIYVSYLDHDDDNYGRSNLDKVFKDNPKYYTRPGNSIYDGPSYRIYYPTDIVNRTDTINAISQSIQNWEARLADNEKAKVEAIQSGKVLQNYSFQAGSEIEYNKAFANVDTRTNTFEVVFSAGLSNDTEISSSGSGAKLEFSEALGTTQGGEWESEEEATAMVGFVLADSGNDYLTVDVYQEGGGMNEDVDGDNIDSKDLNLSTLIFRTRAGATSCPYEDEVVTRYYEPGQHVLSEATLPIEVPEIAVENAFIDNVPSGEPAYVKLFLRNNSAVNFDSWYNLIVDDKANELGANLKMDGGAIGNGRTILVPAGQTVTKILEVTKGPGMNYDDLKLVLASQCQGDPTANFPILADTVSFSVHFTPSCSDIKIASPSKNWVYNTEMPTQTMESGLIEHYMPVKLTGFNVNYDNFKCIRLMYKPSSDSDDNWITLMNYFTDEELCLQAQKNGQNAELIPAEAKGTISYKWFLDKMPDQPYDLCAVTVCDIDNVEVENFSETHSGVKDMYRPRLFGAPQPSNGILTIEDEAMIRFNETIAAGYLTQNNFEVTGVKNGSKTSHSVAVEVDGNDTFVSDLQRSFRGKDLTFEAWINVPNQQNATIFEHGTNDEKLSFGITDDRKLTATINNKVYTSSAVAKENYVNNWNHVALVLNQAEDGISAGRLTLYFNFVAVLEVADVPAYTQTSAYTMARGLVGQIHNIRLWTAVRSSGDIQTSSNVVLSGNEANLLSYYPMDEARGTVLKDKARGLNLAMTGGKWILPEGKALVLNGANSYLKLSSGSHIVVDKESDYTIELWFKGGNMNQNTALLASGKGDGTDFGGSENLFFLGFEDGRLVYKNNGRTLQATGAYLDGNWHHVAVAANRISQRVQIYVDGQLNAYTDATDFGQIAASYIYIGTTPVRTDNVNVICTDFFNGVIDDVRFWNLYKNEKSVAAGMSNRLDGSEMGLLSYLPFEKHGVTEANIPVVRFSLEDMKVPAATATKNADAIAVISDVEFPALTTENRLTLEDAFMTSAIAPVKDLGAAVDLLFDFVVNNDALIVTLKEDPAKVEKTTVTITVSDVRDLNGNKIASPITWTVYIDRNQLKWGEDEINLVKDVNEPLEFTVDIVNKGGFTEDYTISNYPSWMIVEPSYGTLTATQSAHIKFTIDESVNIGTYNEVIYLTNAEGVIEALNVSLKVNGEKPEWNVNPADYKYSMNIYGQLKIDSKFSNDLEDMLAAFENDVCVGVATNQYIRVNDMYYVLLTVYSNNASHQNLEFKMWDASTGTTYVAAPAYEFAFKANTIIGTPKSPVVFTNLDLVQLDMKLNEGWTWTSFNVNNADMQNISEVLKNNQWQNGDEIKREDGGVATYGTREGWVGTLKSFDNEGMFMIRSSYKQTVCVIGEPVDPADNILTIKSVNHQNVAIWNYIPYLAQYNLRLNEALAGYEALEGDVIKSQSAFAMYNNSLGWIGSLEYMQPGQGYMLQRVGTTSATLQYPSHNTQSDRSRMLMAKGMEQVEELGYLNNRYAQTMSVVATVTGVEALEGDVLSFYVNGELRGKSPVICRDEQGRALFFASIAGDKSEAVDVTIERDGEIVASVAGWNNFSANEVRGSFRTPEAINFAGHNESVYPSPFDQELFIQSVVDPEAKVVVTITDLKGAVVALYTDCNEQGQINIHWTGAANCTAGVYLVNIEVDGENSVYKVVKINR